MQRVTDPGQVGSPDRDPASAPVFLVGPARSGTSLLYKVLCLHPEAAYISNWVARDPARTSLASLNRLARSRARHGAARSGSARTPTPTSTAASADCARGMFPMPVEGEPVYAACGIPQDTGAGSAQACGTRRPRAPSLRRRRSRRRRAARVFVNKRIANNLRIPLLAAAFPDARFVVARARRPRRRDVALARRLVARQQALVVRRHAARVGGRRAATRGRLCARNWVQELDAMERGLARRPAGSGACAVATSRSSTRRSRRSTGIADVRRPARRPAMARHRSVRSLRFPNKNEAWRTDLDADALATITDIQRDDSEARYAMSADFAFVLGTGRCGSTLVHEMLARHPDVGFVSNLEDRFPLPASPGALEQRHLPPRARALTREGPAAVRAVRGLPVARPRGLAGRSSAPVPRPAGRGRHAVAERPDAAVLRRARADPGHSRCSCTSSPGGRASGFLQRILPDARFVHVIRDGRAVANSFLQMPWWQGYRGPERGAGDRCRRSTATIWEESGRSFAVLAGLEWRILIEAFEAARAPRSRGPVAGAALRGLRRRAPGNHGSRCLDFLGLEWTPAFESGFRRYRFDPSRNDAYRTTWASTMLPCWTPHFVRYSNVMPTSNRRDERPKAVTPQLREDREP